MPRVTRGTKGRRRHKKILKIAKGYVGGRKLYRQGRETVEKGLTYAFRDRKTKKRVYRGLWIAHLNAACRSQDISYSKFINGLKRAKISLDRKVLADIAARDGGAFSQLVKLAREAAKATAAA